MHIFCGPGFQLLPETYVVLIYAFLNLEAQDGVESAGPDLETAYSLLESMKVSKDMTTTSWLVHGNSEEDKAISCGQLLYSGSMMGIFTHALNPY